MHVAALLGAASVVGCLQLVGVSDWESHPGDPVADAGPATGSPDAKGGPPDADAAQTYADLIKSDRPVAYYRFEETSATSPALDEIAGVDGVYEGSPALAVDGIAGSH